MVKKKKTGTEENFSVLPIITLEKYVMTPNIPQPVKIEDENQQEYLEKCFTNHSEVFFATSETSDDNLNEESILKHGVVCVIDRVMQMPGAPALVFARPVARAVFHKIVYSKNYPMAQITILNSIKPPRRLSIEMKGLIERIELLFKQVINYMGDPEKMTAQKLIEENSSNPVDHVYAICHVAPLNWEEKYKIIESDTFKSLAESLALMLDEAEQKIRLQVMLHERTHQELSQQQKEAFLRTHLKQIQEELGEAGDNDDIQDLLNRSTVKSWSKEAKEHFQKELKKLRKLNINNPEYSIQMAYLDTLLELPWNKFNNKKLSLEKVEEILNRDHYGLDKVKERVLEYMAVLKLRNDLKAPILCLYGPPGVGKTSIGKSVAEAVGREYARISLGGMHDEAEIRGHRRTYIGAMPGRFLQTLTKLKFGNPIILLDEIDKVGKDYKGDPSSALLEALDPEQNNTFHDNFVDFPYDLSKVLFIATANDLNTIPAPLLDRMEIIEMPGYSLSEKKEIAKRHLIDKILEDNGLQKGEVAFTNDALETIIKSYTHEKGVRQLSQAINRIVRKLALIKVKKLKLPKEISRELVHNYLNKDDFKASGVGFRL